MKWVLLFSFQVIFVIYFAQAVGRGPNTGTPKPQMSCLNIQCAEGEHCETRTRTMPCLVAPCPTMQSPICVRSRTTGLPGRSSCATMRCASGTVCVHEKECNEVGACVSRPVCKQDGVALRAYNY